MIDDFYMVFPVVQIAVFMAVATASLPYLARGVQRLIEIFIALVALASAVGGHGLPLNVLGSLAIGWGMTAVVRLAFGSPLGLPSAEDVRLLLEEFGIRAGNVHPAARQVWGVAKFEATEAVPPGRLGVAVYGRDAADARLLTKAGRFLLYRDSGPSLTLTRLQQVEHEAYLTLRAGRAGVTVPEVAEAGTAGPARDALLVCRLPPGTALSDADAAEISDVMLDDLYRQLLILRRARIAHGAISGDAVLADPAAQAVALADFRNASAGASPDQLDRDMAGALAATAVTVGTERAADSAARCLEPELLGGALRYLQKPALDPLVGRSLRGRRGLLQEVRQRAAQAGSIELPKLVEPRRVSWPTLIMIIGTLIGGWALIGVLIDVSKSFDTVIGAEWLWVIMALVLAQLAYVASGLEGVGSVAGPLPFGRAVAVEFANAFSALAGGTAAVFATRVRFFQRQGYDATVALSSGAIMATSSWIAIAVLFLVSLPFAWGNIHLEVTPESGGDSKLVWIILAVVVLVAVAAGLLLAVPRLRRLAADKLRPKARDIWGNLRQVASSPHKLVLLVGGSFAQELLVVMALSVSLRAFGDHLNLPTLYVVVFLAGIIGGISPSPGGLGVVEAGHDPRPHRGRGLGGRRDRRGLHPAPVHLVPAAHLGLDNPRLDAKERVPMKAGGGHGGRLAPGRRRADRIGRAVRVLVAAPAPVRGRASRPGPGRAQGGAAGESRTVAACPRSPRSDLAAGRAGGDPGTRTGPDPLREDAGLAVHVLPGCGADHGGRPGGHPGDRGHRAVVR